MQKLIGPVLIVAGTSIGIGMLTLPALVAASGLFYGYVATFVVWFFMWAAAKAFAELAWNLPLGTNMLTMSERTLGHFGKLVMCTCYILLLYALSSAYLSSLVAISESFYKINHEIVLLFWSLLLAVILVSKFAIFDSCNRFMMLVMVLSFFSLVFGLMITPKHVDHVLIFGSKSVGIAALPILVTAFGYQIVVPSLHKNLGKSDPNLFKRILFWGSLIPLAFYLIWILVMMQQVSQVSFDSMLNSGQPVAMLPSYLAEILRLSWVKPLCLALVCSAIGTSWLGVSISILDFLKDSGFCRYAIYLTFVPPVLFVEFYPNGFLLALNYSGYLVSLLLIILPAIMLLVFRYKQTSVYKFISTPVLGLVLLFGFCILFL